MVCHWAVYVAFLVFALDVGVNLPITNGRLELTASSLGYFTGILIGRGFIFGCVWQLSRSASRNPATWKGVVGAVLLGLLIWRTFYVFIALQE